MDPPVGSQDTRQLIQKLKIYFNEAYSELGSRVECYIGMYSRIGRLIDRSPIFIEFVREDVWCKTYHLLQNDTLSMYVMHVTQKVVPEFCL